MPLRLESNDRFDDNYCTEMCSGSEAGSHSRRIDFVHHLTLGLIRIKKKKRSCVVQKYTSLDTCSHLLSENRAEKNERENE